DGVGHIIKALVTVMTRIALTGGFCVIKATLDDVFGLTRGTRDAIGPAQLTHSLITLHIIDEILDIDLHRWTPVRVGDMGWPQCTPSSHSTTLESNMSLHRLPAHPVAHPMPPSPPVRQTPARLPQRTTPAARAGRSRSELQRRLAQTAETGE